jgi:cation diffusion facilitator CzcD-associated flavoprotein CzcO
MKKAPVAIIGAGPYGLSLAAHLAARGIEHRIFGRPMQFWSQIAAAGGERYLKSHCFSTNLSSPKAGFSFTDYNTPRGLETFEPCSMGNFAAYGKWFQQSNVPWAEPEDVACVSRVSNDFVVTLSSGERFSAAQVIVATGLSGFAHIPGVLSSLPHSMVTHTSRVNAFAAFKGRSVAVVGAGQSALEACALLHEAGAMPQLLVREKTILWHHRVPQQRSLWRRLRSPISGLGTGPTAWALTNFPGAMHRLPESLRTAFVKSHLPAEGAWWLRQRVENKVAVHLEAAVLQAREIAGRVELQMQARADGMERRIKVDHVLAGTGFHIDVDSMGFLDARLRGEIERLEHSPKLNACFESSVPGLRFAGPASAMSFGPLFRFVVGTEYTAGTVAARVAAELAGTRSPAKAAARMTSNEAAA